MQLQKSRTEEPLHELMMAEKRKPLGGFPRGYLKGLFEHLAEKYHLSFYVVRNMYYQEVRNKPKNFETQSIQQLRNISKPTSSLYSVGQILKVKVMNVSEYGAFVETLDENSVEGLIHISEIRDEYIEDIHDYFKTGDIVEAKIIKMMPNQKMGFSTKSLNPPTQKEVQVQNETPFTDIMHFLNGAVGALSPKAKEKLKETIEVYGVVKFAIAMMQASKTFENDLGLIFLEQIEKRIEECL